MCADLLKISSIRMDDQWEPKGISEESVVELILDFLANGGADWRQAETQKCPRP
jgi:hypothetical protein